MKIKIQNKKQWIEPACSIAHQLAHTTVLQKKRQLQQRKGTLLQTCLKASLKKGKKKQNQKPCIYMYKVLLFNTMLWGTGD